MGGDSMGNTVRGWLLRDVTFFFENDEHVLKLYYGLQLCEHTKSHWTVHSEWVNFMVYVP